MNSIVMERMMKFIILIVTFMCVTNVFAQKNSEPSSKKIKEVSDSYAKTKCVEFWTSEDRIKTLGGVGITVSNQCSCVQDEMKFLVSEDLAKKTLIASAKSAENIKLTIEDTKSIDDWMNLYSASQKGCGEKLRVR